MKAITVHQPHASLIVAGIKTIETRPGPPAGGMYTGLGRPLPGASIDRGERIAIHAAAAKPREDETVGPWRVHEMSDGSWRLFHLHPDGEEETGTRMILPLGATIGTVVVADAVPIGQCGENHAHICGMSTGMLLHSPLAAPWSDGETEHDVADQFPLGDFTPGRCGWILEDPEPCDPVPVRGRQGVWEWVPDA